MKSMQATLEGIPMVTPEWIEACQKSNEVVLPESTSYVRSLPTKTNGSCNADFGVAKLAASKEHSETSVDMYMPLGNTYVYLCGFSCKNESNFSALSREAGAKEVITKPSSALSKLKAIGGEASAKFVVLCNDSNVTISDTLEKEIRNHKQHAMVVHSQWLFDSVSCGESLPPAAFKPQGSKTAKDLWKLTCKPE
jgi:hypothetical protein